jgi:hypothetical protein
MIGGLIGGAMGAAIWIAVVSATAYEGGWIAWGVGLLVGIGVRIGAGAKGQGLGPGLVAAAIAVGAAGGAKYAVVSRLIQEPLPDLVHSFEQDPSVLIAKRADRLVEAEQERGGYVPMREGSAAGDASIESDYPADIWSTAKQLWDDLPPEKQREEIRQIAAEHEAVTAESRDEIAATAWNTRFRAKYSLYDALWFGLATFTALRIGAGFARSPE